MSRFSVDDRVGREVDIHNPSKGYRYGTVKRVYSKPYNKKLNLGPYPELYSVIWDDGSFEKDFLPHGLDPIASKEKGD